jgi:putative ABC transport system ATP-binding protein
VTPAIEVVDVRKSFLGTEVLRGVSLAVPAGAFTLVSGPSGSGKTTLLNIACGIDVADAGQVTVAGLELGAASAAERTRFRAGNGVVFQRSGLLGGLTARQNIELGHALTRQPVESAWVRDLAERLGVAGVLDARATRLSGGEAQRVALIRALAHRPSLLFADEPTAAVDGSTKRAIHELLVGVCREEGTTVLMASHDAVSREYADQVVTLVDGRIASEPAVVLPPPERRRGWRAPRR